MSWGDLPSPDELDEAALQLEAVRDSIQSSLKQDRRHEDEVFRLAQSSQRRIAALGPLSASVGDSIKGYDNIMRFKLAEEEERYKREMKTRTVKQEVVYIDAGWRSQADATSTDFRSESDQEFGDVKSEADRNFGTPKARADMLFGIPMLETQRKYEEDEAIKVERARAMAMPGDPTGFVDNLSTIRILQLWRGRPMSELDDAVKKITSSDPYAKSAIGDVPQLRTQAQRLEARRIINSEWRIDLSYGGHDFAVPQAAGAKRPGLDATQAKLVDVLTAIASRSVLSGRYLSKDSKNTIFGFDPMEPFGGAFGASTSTVSPPSSARGLLSNANWALGIHGDQKSIVDRVQSIVGSKDESWLGDQVNFFGSWLMPTSRDLMGEHRTPVDVELAPLRTMMNLRSNLGMAPKTTPIIAADGQVALVGVLDDSDPFYNRSFFIPNWSAVRPQYVFEAARAGSSIAGVDMVMEVGSTFLNPRAAAGAFFDPYDQRFEAFGVDGVVKEKKSGGLTVRSSHEIELDHMVSLKYAWDHGFREMYLGALGDPARLARVQRLMIQFGQGSGIFGDKANFALTSREQNQLKSDKGPDQWLPHPIASDAFQHAGNLFYVQRHLQIVGRLRAAQAGLDGGLDPNFMPTSVAEERAIQRVLRGWDVGSSGVFGRTRDEAMKFWMETLVVPDLSEDPFYLQARASALMTYGTMTKYAATWRLNPYNQAYLLGRKYLSPVFRRAWGRITGESPRQWPSQFSEFRSSRVERADIQSFLREWASQGSYREMTSMITGEVTGGERRVVAPSFQESYRYARGDANPFSVPELPTHPSAGRLRATFDEFRDDYILSYLRSDRGQVFGDAVFKSFSPTTSGVVRASSFEEAYRGIVPLPVRSRLEREAMDEFRKLHIQEQMIRRGRAPLDASPLLTDIYRSLTDRSDGARLGRRIARAFGDVFNDFSIKAIDYGLRARLSGLSVLQTLEQRFISSPTIIGIETISSYVSTMTQQETYVSPIMGKRSLLGHDPFAVLRRPTVENLGLTLRSFRPVGGLARLEAMREADRVAAAAASSAVSRAQRAQSTARAALPFGSEKAANDLSSRLADAYRNGLGGPRHYARVPGSRIVQLPSDLSQTPYDLIWQIHDSRVTLPASSDEIALNDFLSKARSAYPADSRLGLIDRLVDRGDIFFDQETGVRRLPHRYSGVIEVKSVWYPGGGASELGRATLSVGQSDRLVFNPEWSRQIELRERTRRSVFDFRRDWTYPRPGELPSELQRRQILTDDWRIRMSYDDALSVAKGSRFHHWGLDEQIAYDGWLAENGIWRSRFETSSDVIINAPLHAPASRLGEIQYGRRPRTSERRLLPSSDLPPGHVSAALQAEWDAINPPLRGLNTFSVNENFDIFDNAAQRASLSNRIRAFEAATEQLDASRKAARSAREAFRRTWDPERLPPTLAKALDAKGLRRLAYDFQFTNPHTTMLLGRLAHAPRSTAKGFGRVGMAFTVDALENLTIKRSTLTGGKRLFSRGARYGGLGLSAFGGFENIARFDRATGILDENGNFSQLSEEQKTDVLSYAYRTPGQVFLDEGLSALTADPIGLFAAGINRYGSQIIRRRLGEDASFRSELIDGILRDDVPMAQKYRHRAEVKRMNQAGIFPGEGSELMVTSTRDHYRVIAAVQHAAAIQVTRRVKDARTVKQATAAGKAVGKAANAVRWLAGLEPTDDVSVAARDVVRDLRAKEPRPVRSSAAMPIFTSMPYRPGQNLETFSRDDSLRLRRIISSDASRVDHDAMASKRARGMMERIAGDASLLLDPPAAGRDAGFGGFLAAYQNRAAGRELVDQARSAQRDSLVRAGGRVPLDPFEGEPQSFLPKNTFRNLFPLDSLERADLERDRLQAAQRRPRK